MIVEHVEVYNEMEWINMKDRGKGGRRHSDLILDPRLLLGHIS